MNRFTLGLVVVLTLAATAIYADETTVAKQTVAFPATVQSGAAVTFEVWQWDDVPAARKKVLLLKNGMRITQKQLPLSGIQFQFSVSVPHDELNCVGYSTDNFDKIGWGPEKIPNGSSKNLYHYAAENYSFFPMTGKYYLEVEAKNQGQSVAKRSIEFEILGVKLPKSDGLTSVGMTKRFPEAVEQGKPVQWQLWAWNSEPARRHKIADLTNDMTISCQSLPKTGGIQFLFKIPTAHDATTCRALSSDGIPEVGWGPESVERSASAKRLYHIFGEQLSFPPQIGRYCLSAEATDSGASVAKSTIHFEIVNDVPPPQNTHYLKGKKDLRGNPITCSRPVDLTKLNETSTLKDNDYAFEPQRAGHTINFERFPAFTLPARFITIWGTRRFTDEDKTGGPLSRGFSTLSTIHHEQDNLTIPQRMWWHTPDQQVSFINEWYKQDPKKYADLKAYADYRSAFVSKENAYALGKRCYESWGAGGYGPYDAGLYGWDEEQMGTGVAYDMLKNHPEMLPERLRGLRDKDPDVKEATTKGILNEAYERAQAEFIGQGYRAAKESAASRGRKLKIWHYGSKPPCGFLFLGSDDSKRDPNTGKYRYEDIANLPSWFKSGDKVNFDATEYGRQIDYFHEDFYYFNVFPEKASMYEKDRQGKFALDDKGRRKIRQDPIEEKMYIDPVKIGYDDYAGAPKFFKAFIAKGENCMFWLNGGKYYKKHGTFVAAKHLIPTIRPANQETGGGSAQYGQRPISPYMAEAATIYTFMIGLEGAWLWDARLYSEPQGHGPMGEKVLPFSVGDIEFIIKGLHRVSNLKQLFEGDYYYVRPTRHYDTDDRDHPIIRGVMNGRYLALAMTNPYLDPGETQDVELWYDEPYREKSKIWSGKVTLQSRKTHIFQCKLPELPDGERYDPDCLYLRYTCVDGNFKQTFTVTGNYEVEYPYASGKAKGKPDRGGKPGGSFFSSGSSKE